MIELNDTNATDFIENVNDNLDELGSSAEVALTDSASDFVSVLKSELGDNTLSVDDSAETFIGKLNTDFANSSTPSVIEPFDSTKYEAEMTDTMNKVSAMKDDIDLLFVVSTDIHYEQPQYKVVEKNGVTYNVPLKNGYSSNHADTFTPMMSNHKEFLRRADNAGINVDAVVNLGDFYEGRRVDYTVGGVTVMTAKDIVTEYISRMTAPYKELKSMYNVPLIFALGNHDDNVDEDQGWIPNSLGVLYDWFLSGTVDPVNKNTNSSGLDYYIDYASAGIRVVVLWCEESLSDSGGYYAKDVNNWTIPSASLTYLQNCVSSLPTGYKVLILSHTHPHQSRGTNGGTNDLMNYVNENSDKFIGYIFGHSHVDFALGYPIPSYSLLSGKQESGSGVLHTDSNDIWNVVAVDTTHKTINIIRFGGVSNNESDLDKVIHYEMIGGVKGQSYSFEPTISGVTSWGIITNSWTVFTTSGQTTANSHTRYNASNYASIASSSSSSCVVNVNEQDSTYPQCVTVCAKSSSAAEYWTINIPKQQ